MTHQINFQIRPINKRTDTWIEAFLIRQWGTTKIVTRGILHDANHLPGFVGIFQELPTGLTTYHIHNHACEIVTLNSTHEGKGVGSALLDATKKIAESMDCHRLWVITTNDNLPALHFYQKRGFHLVAVHRNAIHYSRKLKPDIPKIGLDGIPIRDEIELEIMLR